MRQDVLHVVPADDLIPHEDDQDRCVCRPRVEVAGAGFVVVHHSLDGRERSE